MFGWGFMETKSKRIDKIAKDLNSRLYLFYVSEEPNPIKKSCDIIFDNTSDHSSVCVTKINPEEYKLFRPSFLHALDILIGNLQLSIFIHHNNQQSKNLTGQ